MKSLIDDILNIINERQIVLTDNNLSKLKSILQNLDKKDLIYVEDFLRHCKTDNESVARLDWSISLGKKSLLNSCKESFCTSKINNFTTLPRDERMLYMKTLLKLSSISENKGFCKVAKNQLYRFLNHSDLTLEELNKFHHLFTDDSNLNHIKLCLSANDKNKLLTLLK